MRLRLRNRPAPFDRTIAVIAHPAPVDAEERAFSSLDLRERALAQDRDELLAECPLPLLVDVALQAKQTPLGHFLRGDFVHDGPLSALSSCRADPTRQGECAGSPKVRVKAIHKSLTRVLDAARPGWLT